MTVIIIVKFKEKINMENNEVELVEDSVENNKNDTKESYTF